jgi:Flp pilus assembly protein TadD
MRRLSVVLFLLSALPVHAQNSVDLGNETLCTLRVDVEFQNKGVPVNRARVELFQGFAGMSPAQVALTNSSGSVQFENVPPGDYSVKVSGEGIETADSGNFRIESGRVFMSELVVVRTKPGNDAGATGAAGSTVTVRELDVPPKALEEFTNGDSEMQRKHWKKAATDFKKAVAIYPQYAAGYYNLSIAYYQMGNKDEQRDALQKTLAIDTRFVPALVSLSHLQFADHKLPETRDLLDKAITADPTNVDALALRVRVDFVQGKYQEAIADAQTVHSLPHQGYATVHYTAAAAYQQLNDIPQMIDQLKIYLKEDPNSASAAYVRKTIAALETPHQ